MYLNKLSKLKLPRFSIFLIFFSKTKKSKTVFFMKIFIFHKHLLKFKRTKNNRRKPDTKKEHCIKFKTTLYLFKKYKKRLIHENTVNNIVVFCKCDIV